MSTNYWMIKGVGLNTSMIEPYLNKEKVVELLIDQLRYDPDDIADLKEMVLSRNFDDFDIDDYMYGCPFDNLADMLTHCDDTDSITYGDDGEGGYYFYYPPSMPWEMRSTEPKNIKEVHDRIIAAVQKITDLESSKIDRMIDDDLFVIGYD